MGTAKRQKKGTGTFYAFYDKGKGNKSMGTVLILFRMNRKDEI